MVELCKQKLLDSTTDTHHTRARLLAAFTKESGYWLQALPISSLGLSMDDSVIHIAVGLRLGLAISSLHCCQHCGTSVDLLATHGLSCRRSQGHHFRHGAVNSIIHRALASAGIPSHLEPNGLCGASNGRPDGVILVPCCRGHPLNCVGFHLFWHICCVTCVPSQPRSRCSCCQCRE